MKLDKEKACREVMKLCQDRVSHLSIISIERKLLQDMPMETQFHESVIDEFAKAMRNFFSLQVTR